MRVEATGEASCAAQAVSKAAYALGNGSLRASHSGREVVRFARGLMPGSALGIKAPAYARRISQAKANPTQAARGWAPKDESRIFGCAVVIPPGAWENSSLPRA